MLYSHCVRGRRWSNTYLHVLIHPGAYVYYLKFILHDWSDAQCHQILTHIREAMRPESKLIIDKFIIPEKDCPMLSAMWDWEMMVFCNSFERSESHWRKVLSKAGFQAKFYYPPGDGQVRFLQSKGTFSVLTIF